MADDQTTTGDAIAAWAGWYNQGGSDKVWGGAVQGATFRSVWGKRGGSLARGEKVLATAAAARALYDKKVSEKASEGYHPVPFDDAGTGIPFLFDAQGGSTSIVTVTRTAVPRQTVFASGHVLPMDAAELDAAIESVAHALSEKVNGERCLVAYDGSALTAYNRKGQLVALPPAAAQHLIALGHHFVLDGERMTGTGQGSYVVFDALDWDGQDLRPTPYSRRIAVLEAAFADHGLVSAVAPSIEALAPNCLYLLTCAVDPAAGRTLVDLVLTRGGEGVIIRTLDAPYLEGDTRHVRKVKFCATLDAFVIRINPGLATGSVTLGLLRPSDGAVIEICNVRSGLKDQDITHLGALLASGERPVLEVEYLPARSVTHKIVEPKTSIAALRTDKTWQECGTDQLGTDKAAIISAAVGSQISIEFSSEITPVLPSLPPPTPLCLIPARTG